jgi:(p)ppGpp synthase/HD superfamily hydrolase
MAGTEEKMDWIIPQFSRRQVNDAGFTLIDPDPEADAFEEALSVINNWRASHAFPLNTFQTTLRRKTKEIDRHSVVAQRIKRLPSIHLKLQNMNNLRLAQMQDIGGCRVVLNNARSVDRLMNVYKRSSIKHELV